MGNVKFFYGDVPTISLQGKRQVQQFIKNIFEQEGKVLDDLTYIFCSDNFILEINQKFLQHYYYTDIITFDLSEQSGTIGEIYISESNQLLSFLSKNIFYKMLNPPLALQRDSWYISIEEPNISHNLI